MAARWLRKESRTRYRSEETRQKAAVTFFVFNKKLEEKDGQRVGQGGEPTHLTQACGEALTDHNRLWVTSSCRTDRSRNGDLPSGYVQRMTTRISEKKPSVHDTTRVKLFRE
ncbi:hypothetical protein E2C01_071124 [Portunus trituberculatus]|uniref:Uncharacterized protein n=1 Tax=Portunus trituberculatus TaxID=210409 RepID=A0A5B7HW50_PORTR|nr:hypothetical protein [Portunus trituberculatus]